MESEDKPGGNHERAATKPRSYLFAVRLWKEGIAGGMEYRGNVRGVTGMSEAGAFCHFRDWPELEAFMCASIEEDERVRAELSEDET